MSPLPPLECLRFFEAAARQRSFARAARELKVTPAAVAYRVKLLEGTVKLRYSGPIRPQDIGNAVRSSPII